MSNEFVVVKPYFALIQMLGNVDTKHAVDFTGAAFENLIPVGFYLTEKIFIRIDSIKIVLHIGHTKPHKPHGIELYRNKAAIRLLPHFQMKREVAEIAQAGYFLQISHNRCMIAADDRIAGHIQTITHV